MREFLSCPRACHCCHETVPRRAAPNITGPPLALPSGHFGLGHGSGAHAPDEYYVIESSNPKVAGFDGAVRSFVDYLFELAVI